MRVELRDSLTDLPFDLPRKGRADELAPDEPGASAKVGGTVVASLKGGRGTNVTARREGGRGRRERC